MQVSHHPEIERDLKKLDGFSAPTESLEAWERLFCLKGIDETPGIKRCSGFGQEKIYKARIIPLKEKCGKSKGYRLIFRVLSDDLCQIVFFSRHGIYKGENELIKIVKDRINA